MEARKVPGMSCLTSRMLQYELKIRNQDAEGSVAELTQRLRRALGENLVFTSAAIGTVSDACIAGKEFVEYVRGLVELFRECVPTRSQVRRLQAQIVHWVNRVQDLLSTLGDEQDRRQVQELRDKLSEAQCEINLLRYDAEGDDGDDEVRGEVHNPVPPQDQSGTKVGDMFMKLPNPILSVIQGIRELSIDSKRQLLQFLWLMIRLQDQIRVFDMADVVVFQVVFPLTTGRLNRFIGEAIASRQQVQEFLNSFLRQHLSRRAYNKLVDEHFYRVQAEGEALAEYVEQIRIAMRALCVPVSEQEAVNNIIEGIRPVDRSRIMFTNRPATFAELDKLVSEVLAFEICDQVRSSRTRSVDNLMSEGGKVERSNPKTKKQGAEGIQCFRCHKWGHVARDCSGFANSRE